MTITAITKTAVQDSNCIVLFKKVRTRRFDMTATTTATTTTATTAAAAVQAHDTVEEIFQWTSKALDEAAEEASEFLIKRKKDIIIETGLKLDEAGIEKSKICNMIVEKFRDRVEESTVRKALKDHPEYKDQKQRDNISKRYLKVEGLNPSKLQEKGEDGGGDAFLALSRPRKEANHLNGELEEDLLEQDHRFSPDEWHAEDHFDIRRVDNYNHWQLVKTVRWLYGKLDGKV